MESISEVLSVFPNDGDVRKLAESIHLARHTLIKDPYQLGPQLVGRLQEIVKKDKPIARLDPRKYPHIK